MLAFSDLTIRVAGRPLIELASATLPSGSRTGLVGRNGSGKTTLFKAITGELTPDTGEINIPKGLRIGQVAQEAPGTQDSLIDIVLAADLERAKLLAAAETEEDPNAIAEIHMRLADIDAHSGEARAAAILSGLGFDTEAQGRPASSFSGGWRMRVALAAVLFSRPDILLLDEPTNYLDLEGTLWLENFVSRYPGTVVIISHDRDLLNNAVSSILHLEGRKLTFYRGGYDSFERQRAEKMMLAEKAREKQEAARKHLQSFVDRFRAKASKARQAQSRIKMIERMQPIIAPVDEHSAPLSFPPPQKLLSSPIFRLEEATAGYAAEAPILRHLDLRIDQDDRIALLGANGNGKSTFAKLLANRLEFVTGGLVKAAGLKVAMFAQHQLDDLKPEETPVAHVRPLMPGAPESRVRARVAQMGLDTSRMDTKARDLSGGEKARLLLGLIAFDGPHLLILDEPTNHLDIDSREALMMALNDFPGAVIVISHDRHLIEATVDRLWLVKDGTVAEYDGDIEDYRSEVLTGKRPKRKQEAVAPQPFVPAAERRKDSAERRRELAPLQKRIKDAENEMNRLRRDIERIDAALAAPGLYERDPARGAKLSRERSEAEKKLVRLEEDWLELSAQYEKGVA